MKATKLIIAFCLMAALASCKSSKDNLTYFSNLPAESTSGTIESGKYEITIIPDDELVITITSLTPEATAPYNAPLTAISNREEKKNVTPNTSDDEKQTEKVKEEHKSWISKLFSRK